MIPKIFGFERLGVELTDRGLKLSLVINELMKKRVEEMKKRRGSLS